MPEVRAGVYANTLRRTVNSLLLIVVVVVIGGACLEAIRRVRAERIAVRAHRRYLEALDGMTTRSQDREGIIGQSVGEIQAHVRVVAPESHTSPPVGAAYSTRRLERRAGRRAESAEVALQDPDRLQDLETMPLPPFPASEPDAEPADSGDERAEAASLGVLTGNEWSGKPQHRMKRTRLLRRASR